MADGGHKGVFAGIGAVQLGDSGIEVRRACRYLLFQLDVSLLQLLRGELAVGDVVVGAYHTQWLAVSVPGDGLADAPVPADLARPGDNPMLDAVIGNPSLQIIVNNALDRWSIFGMERIEPKCCGRLNLSRRIAELG